MVEYLHDYIVTPDSRIDGANMGPTWGRHIGHMNFAIWDPMIAFESF